HTRLINGYGPTENTTFTCCHTITAASLNTTALKSSPPIGSPIANTQVYILDAELQPVPIGVPGELYIAGDGLARGYLNRPELTAAAFVPNPFARVRGQERRGTEGSQKSTFSPSSCLPIASDTLYKTGDRVCYRPDGTIEFLGRLDNQVKIRGFRIELDEIETALLSHPEIAQAVVMPWTHEAAEPQRLVAYVVINPASRIQHPELRRFLVDRLPAYMIPAAFVVLEALPLTSNGKVDRRSLPAPTWESETTGELAQTSVEQTLTEIWAAVLRLETVGRHDNFFDVGGDSILALQMVSRAAQAGISLSPRQIFQYQTIAELALVAETTTNDGITPIVATGAVPLTPIQQWFFAQDLANPHYFNQAVYLELPLDIDRDALERSLQQVVNYHDALRLRFVPTASGWQQHYGDVAGVQPIAWFDLSTLTAADQVQQVEAIANELQASLHLETGPLMRVGGFELGAGGPQRLLIVMHHLVVDGLSWRILLADLRLAYQQEQQGISAQLPPKTHSFQQWAAGLASTAEQAEAGLSYWQNLPLASPLPLDQSPGENIVAAAKMVTASLSRQQTQALLQAVSSTHRTQINDVLLTALVQVLSDWTGRHSHLITLENHGRHAGELGAELNLSRTVGWFTCLHPVALQ
ncbi:MAG: condensation domain-containing protein, partial [Cyanobacteria bacterium P01_C01_bin.147]